MSHTVISRRPSLAFGVVRSLVVAGLIPRGYSWLQVKAPAWLWGGPVLRVNVFVGPLNPTDLVAMTLPVGDRSASQLLFEETLVGEQREAAVVRALCRELNLRAPRSTVLDIGANYGWYAALIVHAAPSLRVIAFEPAPSIYPYLAVNVIGQTTAQPVAVGAQNGSANFYLAKIGAESSLIQNENTNGQHTTVEVRTLDSFGLQAVPFIKCDVEGGELAVVQGAKDLIARESPIWMLEVSESFAKSAGYTLTDLEAELGEGDWYALDRQGIPAKIQHCTDRRRIPGAPNNVFFVPTSKRELWRAAVHRLTGNHTVIYTPPR